jgi:hypothetical protein
MLSTLNTLYKNQTCTIEEKHSSICIYCFLPWEPLFIQVFKPPSIDGVETPHQPSLCSVIHISIKEPLHQQQRIHSITELQPLLWRTKHQKHITYKPTKTTKCKKEQQKLNFRRPQPVMMPNCSVVCHLLPFIHSNQIPDSYVWNWN